MDFQKYIQSACLLSKERLGFCGDDGPSLSVSILTLTRDPRADDHDLATRFDLRWVPQGPEHGVICSKWGKFSRPKQPT